MIGASYKSLGLAGFYYDTWMGDEDDHSLAFNFAGLLRFPTTRSRSSRRWRRFAGARWPSSTASARARWPPAASRSHRHPLQAMRLPGAAAARRPVVKASLAGVRVASGFAMPYQSWLSPGLLLRGDPRVQDGRGQPAVQVPERGQRPRDPGRPAGGRHVVQRARRARRPPELGHVQRHRRHPRPSASPARSRILARHDRRRAVGVDRHAVDVSDQRRDRPRPSPAGTSSGAVRPPTITRAVGSTASIAARAAEVQVGVAGGVGRRASRTRRCRARSRSRSSSPAAPAARDAARQNVPPAP